MSLAFVFPGQGSQSVGMLNELYETYSVVKDTFTEASDVLGFDLYDIIGNGPAEKLNSTEITQPAMLAAGVAVWRLWQEEKGVIPAMMAGHSLGEYSALVCANAIGFRDAVKLVHARGNFMQAAVPKGAGSMAAILGLDDDAVRVVCSEASNSEFIAEAVNFNSPGQVVIAGNTEAIEKALLIAKDKGAKRALLLPVSVPSHCQLMKPAAEKLKEMLVTITINQPDIPVLNNVDALAPTDPDQIRENLSRQLYQPVRWVDIIKSMAQQNIKTIIECGPGKVLMGLNKRIDKTLAHAAIFDVDSYNAIKSQ